MAELETDYLIVGSGAVGLAFADALLSESDAHLLILDRHGLPGGHWNDAYPFVALHQPSQFYGVNSMPLGAGAKDAHGPNAGLFELASGPEVSGYFRSVMHRRLLPSGRVDYRPMTNYLGNGRFASLLSGDETQVRVRRKVVDATYFKTSVPSTHVPKFEIAGDARMVTPNALPRLGAWEGLAPRRYVILGAGKTAMDVGVWLLASGAPPERVSWVVPRDSWLLNRERLQPGMEFFQQVFEGSARQMEAFAEATSVEDLCLRLEAAGVMLRIDAAITPTMFHYATISPGEVGQLQQITHVIRHGHVRRIEASRAVFDRATIDFEADTLFIDCTASAIAPMVPRPIFEPGQITLQLVRAPQPAFSAALIGYVEAHYNSDQNKNALCRTASLPDRPEDLPISAMINMLNSAAWAADPILTAWIRQSRLDGFGKIAAGVGQEDAGKKELLARIRNSAPAAMENLQRLSARQDAAATAQIEAGAA